MAKDPAVSSIACDCLVRADMSLPESHDSSLGGHDMDQVEAVTRRLSVHVGAPWGIDHIDGVIDNTYDDGDLTGKGVRVYIVDTGVQGSHVDFGGRVVNGHTVRARQSPPAYAPAHHSYNTTRPSTPPPPHPLTLSSSRIVPRAHRVRLVPSCQRHPPRRRHWVQRARHPRGLDRRWPQARRRQECDHRPGGLLLRSSVRLRRKDELRLGGRCHRKPRVRPLRTCARLHRTTLTA